MQLFLLKIISFVLVINVNFSRSCYTAVCRASCYWRHHGFDYGYCDNGICKCDPPAVFVFDGVGRDLSDVDIKNSLNNNNVIQRTISTPNPNLKNSLDTMGEINETVTHTLTQTNTVNRKGAIPRSQGQISNDNTSKPTVNINNNIRQNTDSKLNNKNVKNDPNNNKSKNKTNQKLGGDSNDSSEYVEMTRNTKKKVTQEEEENNQHEVVEEFTEEYVTVEDSSETSEVSN